MVVCIDRVMWGITAGMLFVFAGLLLFLGAKIRGGWGTAFISMWLVLVMLAGLCISVAMRSVAS